MKPEKVICELLKAEVLTAFVGERIYPVKAPKGSDLGSAFLVFRKISDVHQNTVAQNSNFVLKKRGSKLTVKPRIMKTKSC